jgi:hypothetical protein
MPLNQVFEFANWDRRVTKSFGARFFPPFQVLVGRKSVPMKAKLLKVFAMWLMWSAVSLLACFRAVLESFALLAG